MRSQSRLCFVALTIIVGISLGCAKPKDRPANIVGQWTVPISASGPVHRTAIVTLEQNGAGTIVEDAVHPASGKFPFSETWDTLVVKSWEVNRVDSLVRLCVTTTRPGPQCGKFTVNDSTLDWAAYGAPMRRLR